MADGRRTGQTSGGKGGRAASGKGGAGRRGTGPAPRTTGGARPAAGRSTAARQSVAAARRTKPGSNRTQLIIGGVAVVIMIAVVVVGLVLNANQGKATSDYGASTKSTATLSADGVVTVSAPGSTPKATLDFYEDPMCPFCALFEQQYGDQINENVDKGTLAVRYHMLDFLNANSHSGDYSTRASAAMMCVAQDSGTRAGGFLSYLEKLFAQGTQPEEQGSSDLSNAQLAELATQNGASSAAASCITSGAQIDLAKTESAAGQAQLKAALGSQWGTPTVLQDGKQVNTNSTDWLTKIVG
ncbi:DsbA family protein [Nakamurella endophytica]|uniref:Thioredoxin-like fold domain-containing protein n=1 Tax=Nakamurella endophytica TaxID=1748367 RepID=A0A917WIY1_9ACTN|nr:thioredoxin domain-containing protein [Nakamurella endophytica]GGM07424.1 hypothetical protein GCM10011594_29230 [Nakamurella endophytica]